MKALFVLLVSGLLIGTATVCPAEMEFAIDTIDMPYEDCSAPKIASSDQGLTMVSFTAEGVVAMSFIVAQMMPTHPEPGQPWPPPVTVAQGSNAEICWSRSGFTMAIANGTVIQLLHADHDGDWGKAESYLMDAGGEVLSMDLWGVPTDAAGPAVYLTWSASSEPWVEAGEVFFASRSAFGWSEPIQLTENTGYWPHPYPQTTWSLGPAGPLPTVFYLNEGPDGPQLVYRRYDVDLGWVEPVEVSGFPSGGTCFGGPFEVVTAYNLDREILGLGPQPTCPCGTIHHQYSSNGEWHSCDNLTVDYGYYDWPMSPCFDVESDGTVHALWYQLDSAPDLSPHRGYIEYRVGKHGVWEDPGDFLDNLPSGPIQSRLALEVSPNDMPVLAWSRRDTIEGEPQPEQVWVARQRDPSDVADDLVPSAAINLKAWPNPFNPMVQLAFRLESADQVQLEIFDSRGRRVTSLADGVLEEGSHSRTWQGRDGFGKRVPSGVYFAKLAVGDQVTTRKLVLAK